MAHLFEYLDHTADVQIHAWGATLPDAFINAALGMYNYLTPLAAVAAVEAIATVDVEGHDAESLLFAFLDECLFQFHTELTICSAMTVETFSREEWRFRALGKGETFDRGRHQSGTEVKAITYSAMKIVETASRVDVYVIVDI